MDAEQRQVPDREAAASPKWFVAVLFFLSMLAQQCAPSLEQAGAAILIAAPIVFLGGLAALGVLRAAWRSLTEVPEFPGRSHWVTLGILVALAGLALAFGAKGSLEWVGVAIVAFGTSYLSLLFVVFRLFLRRRPEKAFRDVPIAIMALMLLFAPVLAWMDMGKEASEYVVWGIWIAPGLVGQTTMPIAAALLIEVVVRRVRKG